MPLYFGDKEVSDLNLGSEQVTEVYLGSDLVWSSAGEWTPAELFKAGEEGVWYDFTDLSTMFTEVDGTGAASVGDNIRSVVPKAGHDLNKLATQSTNTQRPLVRQTGNLVHIYCNNDQLVVPTGVTGDATSPLSVIVVFRVNNWVDNDFLMYCPRYYVQTISTSVRVFLGISGQHFADITALLDDETFNYVAYQSDPTDRIKGEYNGVVGPERVFSGTKTADAAGYIGGQSANDTSSGINGDIMHVVLLNRLFTDQEFRDIETWAEVQYGLYHMPGALPMPDQLFDMDSGVKKFDTSPYFNGAVEGYTLLPNVGWATIDPATGIISFDTNTSGEVTDMEFTVTATNAYGSANNSFNVTVGEWQVDWPIDQVVPGTALDFRTSFPAGLEFTRASSATMVDETGTLITVGPDVPRWPHHIYENGDWKNVGLLYEVKTTSNYLLYSEDFENSTWKKTNAVVTNSDIVSPTGELTGAKIEEAAVDGNHEIYQSNVATSSSYSSAFSVYLKAGTRSWVRLEANHSGGEVFAYFDLANGVPGSASTGITPGMEPSRDGWWRCSVSFDQGADTTTTYRIQVSTGDGVESYMGEVGKYVYAFGAQMDYHLAPMSYLKTTDTAIPHVSDKLTIPKEMLPSGINVEVTVAFNVRSNWTAVSTDSGATQFLYWGDANYRLVLTQYDTPNRYAYGGAYYAGNSYTSFSYDGPDGTEYTQPEGLYWDTSGAVVNWKVGMLQTVHNDMVDVSPASPAYAPTQQNRDMVLDRSGVYILTWLRVWDTALSQDGLSEAAMHLFEIAKPKTLATGAPVQFYENTGLFTYATAHLFEGRQRTYSLVSPPEWVTIDSNTGVVTMDTDTSGVQEDYVVTVRASNSSGHADTTFTAIVVADYVGPFNRVISSMGAQDRLGKFSTPDMDYFGIFYGPAYYNGNSDAPVDVFREIAFVIDNDGVASVDLVPDTPVLIQNLDVTGAGSRGFLAGYDLVVSATTGVTGIAVADPSAMVPYDIVDAPSEILLYGLASTLDKLRRVLFVSSSETNVPGIYAFNTRDIANITEAGRFKDAGLGGYSQAKLVVDTDTQVLYRASAQSPYNLTAIYTSDLQNMSIASEHSLDRPTYTLALDEVNKILYMGTNVDIRAIDVSDPTAMVEITSFNPAGTGAIYGLSIDPISHVLFANSDTQTTNYTIDVSPPYVDGYMSTLYSYTNTTYADRSDYSYQWLASPQTVGTIADQIMSPDTGTHTLDISGNFDALGETYSLSPTVAWATIDSGTGVISFDTDISGEQIEVSFTVTASNVIGEAVQSFDATVRQSQIDIVDSQFISTPSAAAEVVFDLTSMDVQFGDVMVIDRFSTTGSSYTAPIPEGFVLEAPLNANAYHATYWRKALGTETTISMGENLAYGAISLVIVRGGVPFWFTRDDDTKNPSALGNDKWGMSVLTAWDRGSDLVITPPTHFDNFSVTESADPYAVTRIMKGTNLPENYNPQEVSDWSQGDVYGLAAMTFSEMPSAHVSGPEVLFSHPTSGDMSVAPSIDVSGWGVQFGDLIVVCFGGNLPRDATDALIPGFTVLTSTLSYSGGTWYKIADGTETVLTCSGTTFSSARMYATLIRGGRVVYADWIRANVTLPQLTNAAGALSLVHAVQNVSPTPVPGVSTPAGYNQERSATAGTTTGINTDISWLYQYDVEENHTVPDIPDMDEAYYSIHAAAIEGTRPMLIGAASTGETFGAGLVAGPDVDLTGVNHKAGDLLICTAYSLGADPIISNPGWTQSGTAVGNGTLQSAVFHKISDGTETVVQFSTGGTNTSATVVAARNAVFGGANGIAGTQNAPAAGNVDGHIVLSVGGSDAHDTVVTPPAGYNYSWVWSAYESATATEETCCHLAFIEGAPADEDPAAWSGIGQNTQSVAWSIWTGPQVPINTVPPVIEENARILSFTSEGTWDLQGEAETDRAYKWYLDNAEIPGATGTTHDTTGSDGWYKGEVIVSTAQGSTPAQSDPILIGVVSALLNATYSQSSTYTDNQPADFESMTNGYTAETTKTGTNSAIDSYVQARLEGGIKTVTKIVVGWPTTSLAGGWDELYLNGCEIEYSTDRVVWNSLGTIPTWDSGTYPDRLYTLDGLDIQAEDIRVRQPTNDYMAVTELAVWGY